jgi:hypothetical protein
MGRDDSVLLQQPNALAELSAMRLLKLAKSDRQVLKQIFDSDRGPHILHQFLLAHQSAQLIELKSPTCIRVPLLRFHSQRAHVAETGKSFSSEAQTLDAVNVFKSRDFASGTSFANDRKVGLTDAFAVIADLKTLESVVEHLDLYLSCSCV